jgi:hypothetical protein
MAGDILAVFRGRRDVMNLLLALLIVVVLASLPTWPYSTAWGYYPSGGLGILVIVFLLLMFTRRGAV